MFDATIDQLADAGIQKAQLARTRPLSFLIGSAMAGAYVGFGAILMFTVGAHADPAWARILMGSVFALGLILITFAGGHLFTGYTMQMALAWLCRKTSGAEVLAALARCWCGNLVGAALLAVILKLAGGGVLLTDGADLFYKTAAAKANAPALSLMFKAILCNWLVCLTVWMGARTTSDTARLGLVFWPVMMFAACGFEHSIANMFTFALALLSHADGVTLGSVLTNLAWVTLGNAIGGMLMVGAGYWVQSQHAPAPGAAGAARLRER
ncbi:nitrite transporter NirC [Massilia sp. TW-1]|uniref:Nitrite transporter NirC n=1 Tax=Telluria antibiotica TaxID=2717319 RepID=A0ABX0PLT6_9BURK|nr:formate/nitrite transporter family protein [Telluria antibiotica]NIA57328.1 nitrite transporter NirC [Telluria antibiotica]